MLVGATNRKREKKKGETGENAVRKESNAKEHFGVQPSLSIFHRIELIASGRGRKMQRSVARGNLREAGEEKSNVTRLSFFNYTW